MQGETVSSGLDVVEKVLASAAILLPATWALWTKLRARLGHISWRTINRAVDGLYDRMIAVSYRPACIVCIGRAGAITGSLLSERFGRPLVPIVVLAFDYVESEASGTPRIKFVYRRPQFVDFGTIRENVDNVLLLGIDVVTGSTMAQAAEELKKRGVTCSATACLFWNPEAAIRPMFFVAERSSRAKYPWNLKSFGDRYGLSGPSLKRGTEAEL